MQSIIQLTAEQQEAVDEAVATLLTEGVSLTIGGYAGTGKTTIIKAILERLNAPPKDPKARRPFVAVAAFTGKAVSVLRRKGIQGAQTLHSLMYETDEDPVTKKLTFIKRSILGDPDLPITAVIIDESSMLNTTLYDDLKSYGLPLVFIGDHGQLEPIGDNPNVMAEPDIRLEAIHRQASQSPILKLAHGFREGQRIAWETIPAGCGLAKVPRFRVEELCTKVDVILCGFNRTRAATNKMVRKRLGRKACIEVGERLICLKNDRQRGVFNGMLMTVKQVIGPVAITNAEHKGYDCWSILAVDDDERERGLLVYVVQEGEMVNTINAKYWTKDSDEYPSSFVVMDYGYCLTVHKAQGSEWPKVMVIEELHPEQNATRWRYTAATRAVKELIWVRP